ncbi:membrane protein [Klebsiella pneumoniae]|uniref:Membrane protein n=1 Tax=Klebsiella pneumoniae TaxID=573 RepID=A0A4P0Y393_KLEPN|nr:membrane protein [Klebsiella pneumoniae]
MWSVLRSKLTLIDNFGWLDNASIPFSMSRIGAIVSLGIALYLIYSSSWAKAATVEIPVGQYRGGADDYCQRFSSRLALTPPKPKPFDSA